MKISGPTRCYKNFYRNALTCCDLEQDSYSMGLVSSKHVPDVDTHKTKADLSHELVGNGYARQKLSDISLKEEGDSLIWSCKDVKFIADGGDLTCRYWFIINDSHDVLFLFGGIDEKKTKDTIITDGNSLTIYCAQGLWGLNLG